jgi:hypothetical protein
LAQTQLPFLANLPFVLVLQSNQFFELVSLEMRCPRWAATGNGGVLPLQNPLNLSAYAIKNSIQKSSMTATMHIEIKNRPTIHTQRSKIFDSL